MGKGEETESQKAQVLRVLRNKLCGGNEGEPGHSCLTAGLLSHVGRWDITCLLWASIFIAVHDKANYFFAFLQNAMRINYSDMYGILHAAEPYSGVWCVL